jgi:hypothetical protein
VILSRFLGFSDPIEVETYHQMCSEFGASDWLITRARSSVSAFSMVHTLTSRSSQLDPMFHMKASRHARLQSMSETMDFMDFVYHMQAGPEEFWAPTPRTQNTGRTFRPGPASFRTSNFPLDRIVRSPYSSLQKTPNLAPRPACMHACADWAARFSSKRSKLKKTRARYYFRLV